MHVPPATDRIVFILNLGGMRALRSWPEYRVEIASADGRVAWSRRGIARSPDGTFAVETPRGFLAPGEWRIRLAGRADHGWDPVAEYAIRLRYD